MGAGAGNRPHPDRLDLEHSVRSSLVRNSPRAMRLDPEVDELRKPHAAAARGDIRVEFDLEVRVADQEKLADGSALSLTPTRVSGATIAAEVKRLRPAVRDRPVFGAQAAAARI